MTHLELGPQVSGEPQGGNHQRLRLAAGGPSRAEDGAQPRPREHQWAGRKVGGVGGGAAMGSLKAAVSCLCRLFCLLTPA